MTRPRHALVCGAVVAVALLLAGCTGPAPEPTPSETSAPPAHTPDPDPVPVLDGTAEQNRPFFDWVNRGLVESGATLDGAAFVDNLVANGYPREAMEVTPDTTAIGLAADNIVFSIRFDDECLLGQWGNVGYLSGIAPVLSTGRCLIGTARPAADHSAG